ncbi:MAG TPA: hypothetical protein VGM77_07480 [Gemmatimonadales bacterium]
MSVRRYTEAEVAAIFLKAAEDPQASPFAVPGDEGLTLADLQEIGREVGIPAESVALAAQSVDLDARVGSQTYLGLPIGVERTVALNRRITEEEWEQLVVELREVFNTRGTVSSTGSLRQWTNGNLQALLEPTATGDRLRLRTFKGDARAQMAAGLATVGITAAVALASAAGIPFGHAAPGFVVLFAAGAAMFANSALRLPAWARLRRRQMEAIAARLALPADRQPPPQRPVSND